MPVVLWSLVVLQPQYVKKFNPISDANKANNGGSWNFGGWDGGNISQKHPLDSTNIPK